MEGAEKLIRRQTLRVCTCTLHVAALYVENNMYITFFSVIGKQSAGVVNPRTRKKASDNGQFS